jgi:hypothetical protein
MYRFNQDILDPYFLPVINILSPQQRQLKQLPTECNDHPSQNKSQFPSVGISASSSANNLPSSLASDKDGSASIAATAETMTGLQSSGTHHIVRRGSLSTPQLLRSIHDSLPNSLNTLYALPSSEASTWSSFTRRIIDLETTSDRARATTVENLPSPSFSHQDLNTIADSSASTYAQSIAPDSTFPGVITDATSAELQLFKWSKSFSLSITCFFWFIMYLMKY